MNEQEKNLFLQVNRAEGSEKLTDLEKKHHPVIECPDRVKKGEVFKVNIEVGKLLEHPNENTHYIEWIELSADDLFISRVDLIPVVGKPKVTLTISLNESHNLKVRIRCNLHGIWENSKEIKVE